MASYSSGSFRHGSALAAAATFVALALAQPRTSQAITLNGTSDVVAAPSASVCYRSPDIVVVDNVYYVTYVAGPCSGAGMHTVRIARFDGAAMPMSVDVVSISALEVRAAPLARISAAGGQLAVLVANRSMSVSLLATYAFDRNLGRQTMMGPQNAQGYVTQLSFDCNAVAFPPCVASTLETIAGMPRVYSYFTITNPGVPPPLGTRVDRPIAVAAIAGTTGQSATVFATDSTLDAAPNVMVSYAPMGGLSPLGMGGEPVMPGVAAVRLPDSRVAAFWSQPGTVNIAPRAQWNLIPGTRTNPLSIMGDPYFLIEDAAVVGANTVLVGRTSPNAAGLDGAPIGYASTTLSPPTRDITVRNAGVVARSATRVAASVGSCVTAGKGAFVYALGAVGAPNEIHLRRFACNETTECVDPDGMQGRCDMGVCRFSPGSMCAPQPDAGVADGSAPDASAPDAMPQPDASGSDASVADVTESDGSTVDSGALDAAIDVAPDASAPRDGGNPPAITGGACACRATGSTHKRAAGPWLAILAALAVASRRRR